MHTAPIVPQGQTDAANVLRNPAAYADQPSLITLARMVLASATGTPISQTRRKTVAARQTPAQRRAGFYAIAGGRA